MQHVHNWNYLSSQRGRHVTRECRCGWIRETNPDYVVYFDGNGRRTERRGLFPHEAEELNKDINALMPMPIGRATPAGMVHV